MKKVRSPVSTWRVVLDVPDGLDEDHHRALDDLDLGAAVRGLCAGVEAEAGRGPGLPSAVASSRCSGRVELDPDEAVAFGRSAAERRSSAPPRSVLGPGRTDHGVVDHPRPQFGPTRRLFGAKAACAVRYGLRPIRPSTNPHPPERGKKPAAIIPRPVRQKPPPNGPERPKFTGSSERSGSRPRPAPRGAQRQPESVTRSARSNARASASRVARSDAMRTSRNRGRRRRAVRSRRRSAAPRRGPGGSVCGSG